MRKIIFLVILFLLVLAPTSIAAVTPSGIAYTELEKHIDAYANDYIGTTTAGANIVIVKDGAVFLNRSYGFTDIENEQPIASDTVWEWGSVTKLFVWTSVMQLVEQGKLDLHTDIQSYLPAGTLKKLQFDEPITLQHLMHHSAGWEDRYVDLFYTSADDMQPLQQMLHITEPQQIHKPGDVVAYSNFGVALAGFIVENIAEQPFYEYVYAHIFSVLKMKDSTIHPTQQDHLDVASRRDAIHGYDNALKIAKNERSYIGLYPAGSAIGTAEDLTKFMRALMPNEGDTSPLFETNETLEQMLTISDWYENGVARNAHGFWHGLYAVNTLGHAGNSDSFSSQFLFSREERLGIIVLTNQKNEVALNYGLPTLLLGQYSPTVETLITPDKFSYKDRFQWARQPYEGFGKLYGALNTKKIERPSANELIAFDTTYKQIATDLYQSTDGSNDHLHVKWNDGQIEKISSLTTDLLPVSVSNQLFNWFSFIAIAFSIIYTLVMLVRCILGGITVKWEIILLIANIIPVVNVIVLFIRALDYTPYAALTVHFGLNIAYVIVVAFCVVMLGRRIFKIGVTRRETTRYILSSISSVLLVVLIFGWGIYY